jgi:hypothetical protein
MSSSTTIRALVLASGLALGVIAPLAARANETSAAKEGFGTLTVDQVEALIAKKEASIFDNNGEDRFKKSHVPTAKWLQFNQVQASDLPADLDHVLVFYCANTH